MSYLLPASTKETDAPESTMVYVPHSAHSYTGAKSPTLESLRCRTITLEPLNEMHFAALFDNLEMAQCNRSPIWRYVVNPFDSIKDYAHWIDIATQLKNASSDCYYTVLRNHVEPIGLTGFINIQPLHGTMEYLMFLSKSAHSTIAFTECTFVMLKHAFEDLGYRRVAVKMHVDNQPARIAAKRMGISSEGVWRNHYILRGENRDTAWYSTIDSEWNGLKAVLEAWLHPDNFNSEGKRKKGFHDHMYKHKL